LKKANIIILFVVLVLVVIICNIDNLNNEKTETVLIPKQIIELKVPEPSGLYFDKSNNTLWTVSDENSTIYNIDLEGEIINQIIVDGFDLEGITKTNDSTIVTILERERTVLFLDTNGVELKKVEINLPGEPNMGLEGVTYNSITTHLYIVNEKEPGLLLEIDKAGKVIKTTELDYATDYSGLDFCTSANELWIISDECKSVLQCSNDGALIKKYKVYIEQIEGVAIDHNSSLIYIVSDPLEKLYIFELP